MTQQQDRINADAEKYANKYLNGKVNTMHFALLEESYIAGATAEAERAQVLVDILKRIKSFDSVNDLTKEFIDEALQKWEGKEVLNGK